MAYRISYTDHGRIYHAKCYECYHCSKFYVQKERYRKHVETCSGIPGITYFFENHNNLIIFESSCSKNDYIDIEDDEMYPVLYVLVFAFHPKLNRDRKIAQRSFGDSMQQLWDVSYLPGYMLSLISCNCKTIEGCCNES